ncbi:MAG: hypothetical protein IPF98_07335 [Gemmatimonadetes bacterium]|nr:hypothetical protein [Gemmatimonadota bacterium]MCC6772253.1 hypothetical protein [Gemmatimonadaceae bacterium]
MSAVHYLCTQCGAQTSAPLKVPPGSAWVALALAVPFIVPGVIYTVWRFSMRRSVCPTCGHAQLIPANAPLARTWRASGWVAGRPAEPSASIAPTTSPDIRIDRIEQAIDAIAGEVDRIANQQRVAPGARADREPAARLRERSSVTPT